MRLIDADALIEAMKKTESEHENSMTCPSWWSAFNVISEQPTAYSVDKVVEELEEKAGTVNFIGYGTIYEAINKDVAIEIVKQGGVDDDVCEWKYTSDGEFIQNPHTKRLYSNEPSMQNVYCNTCGKKINIVGD